MKPHALFPLFLIVLSGSGLAQQPHETEVQRALIELDRRSAGVDKPLAPQVGRPLDADPVITRELRPYERLRETQPVRVLRLPPRVEGDRAPLPLPGGPQAGVDPVTAPSLPN